MKTRTGFVMISLALLVVAVGCRSLTGRSLGTNIDNATTTATVKAKLTADRVASLTRVNVDTDATTGTVHLRGRAETEAQKQRAEEIARSVAGVQHVVNEMQVVGAGEPAASRAAAAPSAIPAATLFGRRTMTGEVTRIEADRGRLTLQTADGELNLQFPPAALANVRVGDRVTIDLGIRPAR